MLIEVVLLTKTVHFFSVVPSIQSITDSGLTSNTVRLGASTTLTCSASGTQPLQYQWKHNGTVRGVTSPTYRVSSAEPSDAGQYTCQVSNWAGADSGAYTLNVQGTKSWLHINMSTVQTHVYVIDLSSMQLCSKCCIKCCVYIWKNIQ